MGTHSAFGEKSHTTAYTPKQGPSLPRPQCGFALPAKSLQSTTFATLDSAVLLYTYISRFSVAPPLSATALSQTIFHRVFQLLAQTAHVCFHRQKRVHTRLSEKDRTQGHTRRNRWRFGWGWYHYPRSVSHGSETLRGRVSERQTLPLLGLGRVYARRTQKACGTAMRLCASLFRGVAAPLGCVICLQLGDVAVFSLCAQGLSVCARRGVVSLPSARFTCC